MIKGKQQSGFTLVEVMVSAVILSIGLIGVAGLQAMSLSNNQSAFMRSQASALAYDLADRMRSNAASATGNLYVPSAAAMAVGCSSNAGCTPQQLAQHDIAEWNAAITTYLPMGLGFVCLDSTPNDGTAIGSPPVLDPQCDGAGSELSIKIWWDDNRDGEITVPPATPTITERFVISVQL